MISESVIQIKRHILNISFNQSTYKYTMSCGSHIGYTCPEKPPFLFIKAICMPVTKHSEWQAISKAMV
jgi:hypothetical protein